MASSKARLLRSLRSELERVQAERFELVCKQQCRPFGMTGRRLFVLGIGTIWFGRPWPPNNANHKDVQDDEISAFLSTVFSALPPDVSIMIDTAAGYGFSEEKVGAWLRQNTSAESRSFIATKFGEQYENSTGETTVDLSSSAAISSFHRSKSRLGRVDLYYSHITSQISNKEALAVLRDTELTQALMKLKEAKQVKLLGTSISHAQALRSALEEGLLGHLDVVQLPANLVRAEGALLKRLAAAGKAIVVNSPIRKKQKQVSAPEAYAELLALPHEHVHMVLTGTRSHLRETLSYALPAVPPCGVVLRPYAPSDAGAVRAMWQRNHVPGHAHSLISPPDTATLNELFSSLVSIVAVEAATGELVGFTSANLPTDDFNRAAPPLVAALQAYPSLPPSGCLLGPVCVGAPHRGTGLFRQLHLALRQDPRLRGREAALMVNEANVPSVKAHMKLPGLREVAVFDCEANSSRYRLFSLNF